MGGRDRRYVGDARRSRGRAGAEPEPEQLAGANRDGYDEPEQLAGAEPEQLAGAEPEQLAAATGAEWAHADHGRAVSEPEPEPEPTDAGADTNAAESRTRPYHVLSGRA
jgi:hypothetical protein